MRPDERSRRQRERGVRRIDGAPAPLGQPGDELASGDTGVKGVEAVAPPCDDGLGRMVADHPNVSREIPRATRPPAEPRLENGGRKALAQPAAERRHGRRDHGGDLRVGEERDSGRDPVSCGMRAATEHRDELGSRSVDSCSVLDAWVVERRELLPVADDGDTGRLVDGARAKVTEEPALALVGPEDPEPVEDRRGVPERKEGGVRPDPGAREPVVELHRKLTDPPVSELRRDREQLEVEGEPLDEQQGDDLVDDPPAEDLQPDLRVAHVEPEEEAVELLVAPAGDPPRCRVLHGRAGVPLRSDHTVELLRARKGEVLGDRRRVEVEIGVDESDPVSARRKRAGLHRIALAEVAVVVDDPDAEVATALQQPLAAAVDRAIRDDDHLDVLGRQLPRRRPADCLDVVDDLRAAVVHGHDDAQHRPRAPGRIRGIGGEARGRADDPHRVDSRVTRSAPYDAGR
jgi:hypothetical protein